jgi:hypothetical protein
MKARGRHWLVLGASIIIIGTGCVSEPGYVAAPVYPDEPWIADPYFYGPDIYLYGPPYREYPYRYHHYEGHHFEHNRSWSSRNYPFPNGHGIPNNRASVGRPPQTFHGGSSGFHQQAPATRRGRGR